MEAKSADCLVVYWAASRAVTTAARKVFLSAGPTVFCLAAKKADRTAGVKAYSMAVSLAAQKVVVLVVSLAGMKVVTWVDALAGMLVE